MLVLLFLLLENFKFPYSRGFFFFLKNTLFFLHDHIVSQYGDFSTIEHGNRRQKSVELKMSKIVKGFK